jgi:hypothetical protein
MKALVVYESMYGNTEQVAHAIGAGLADAGIATAVHPVGRVEPAHVPGVDLLVVGGPTHVHGMTRPTTREQARKDDKNTYEDPTADPGLRGWMDELPGGQGHLAAAFDTRIDGPKAFTGSAAKGIAHRLDRHGFELAGEPGSFLVTKENTLVDGELVRARQWAKAIAERTSVRL